MSQRADHILRKSMNDPVLIQGVWLDANAGRIVVRVEVGGEWRNIIDLPNIPDGGHISHIIEPPGILSSPLSNIR